jgi:probable F420-dependent oxidoreductase
MNYAIDIATLGDLADPRRVVELAVAAEEAGWQGLFVWDHLAFSWGVPSGDPWVMLSAVAQATQRLKIGTAVTPVPRRRPQVLANTVATLDLLSQGRVIFGAGLGGVPQEFAAYGEPEESRQRALALDEGLEVMDRLWSGEPVNYEGACFRVHGVTLSPLPVQRPRVPVWVGGESRAALRRAARWDGWVAGGDNEKCEMVKTPAQVAEMAGFIRTVRTTDLPFNIALTGVSRPADGPMLKEYADAGVTWWLESIHGFRGSFEELKARVQAGPAH